MALSQAGELSQDVGGALVDDEAAVTFVHRLSFQSYPSVP